MSTGLFSIGPRAVAQLGHAPKASAQLPAGITRHLVSDRFSLISEKRSRKSAARLLPFILGRAHHVIPSAVLKYFRQFNLAFPAQSAFGIGHTLCDQLHQSICAWLRAKHENEESRSEDRFGAHCPELTWTDYRRQVFGAERKQSAFCIQVPALPAQRGGIACRD